MARWARMPESRWFDTHAHLDRYPRPERAALLERAGAGVDVIAVATDLASSREVAAIADVRGRVVGVHPKFAHAGFERELEDIARMPGVVAVGECGFDGDHPGRSLQREVFVAQCGIARSLDKAIVLHVDGAGAWEQLTDCGTAVDGLSVVRHYFTGDAAQAEWHRERGHYLSFGNPLRRSPALREIARDYPVELLLIETDAYPLPGRVTEPKDVARIGETLALIRGWTFEEAREQLGRNTLTAFPGLSA